MWGPKYCRRQCNEGCKSEPVVSRRSYGPVKDRSNACRSQYGAWNECHGVRCGLWDDVLFQYSPSCLYQTKRRRNVSMPISKVSTPSQHTRYEALATPKKNGCGPNCKKSRCAATEPPYHYAKPPPHCAADKRNRRTRSDSSAPSAKKYTLTTMAHAHDKVLDLEGYDMPMTWQNFGCIMCSLVFNVRS